VGGILEKVFGNWPKWVQFRKKKAPNGVGGGYISTNGKFLGNGNIPTV